jgi:hypothetical protein
MTWARIVHALVRSDLPSFQASSAAPTFATGCYGLTIRQGLAALAGSRFNQMRQGRPR